jgi:hypothetical protein
MSGSRVRLQEFNLGFSNKKQILDIHTTINTIMQPILNIKDMQPLLNMTMSMMQKTQTNMYDDSI